MRHHLLQEFGALDDGIDHRSHFLRELRNGIALDALGRVLDQVDDVVEIVREPQDVLAIDGRLERAVGADEDLPRHRVGPAFDHADRRDMLVGRDFLLIHHVAQLLRGLDDAVRLLAELAREALLGRHQPPEQIEGHRIRFAIERGMGDHSYRRRRQADHRQSSPKCPRRGDGTRQPDPVESGLDHDHRDLPGRSDVIVVFRVGGGACADGRVSPVAVHAGGIDECRPARLRRRLRRKRLARPRRTESIRGACSQRPPASVRSPTRDCS